MWSCPHQGRLHIHAQDPSLGHRVSIGDVLFRARSRRANGGPGCIAEVDKLFRRQYNFERLFHGFILVLSVPFDLHNPGCLTEGLCGLSNHKPNK